MNQTRPVVFFVVGPIAFVLIVYALTLCYATVFNISPDPKVLEYLKDAGIYAAGALSSILAQTRGSNADPPPGAPHPLPQPQPPVEVTVVNPPSDPANVVEHKPKP